MVAEAGGSTSIAGFVFMDDMCGLLCGEQTHMAVFNFFWLRQLNILRSQVNYSFKQLMFSDQLQLFPPFKSILVPLIS